jgi:hypothetical protein
MAGINRSVRRACGQRHRSRPGFHRVAVAFHCRGRPATHPVGAAEPSWPHLEAATEVRLAVPGGSACIPSYWRAKAGGPDEDGVPTSYYTAVLFICRPTAFDDPLAKADILVAQLADFQPRTPPRPRAKRPSGGSFTPSRGATDRVRGGRQVRIRRRQIPSSTVNVSSAILSSAATASMQGSPRSSSGG